MCVSRGEYNRSRRRPCRTILLRNQNRLARLLCIPGSGVHIDPVIRIRPIDGVQKSLRARRQRHRNLSRRKRRRHGWTLLPVELVGHALLAQTIGGEHRPNRLNNCLVSSRRRRYVSSSASTSAPPSLSVLTCSKFPSATYVVRASHEHH